MSQSLSQIWIHIVYSTKDRSPFFKNPIILQKVHDYMQAICRKQNCVSTAIGGTADHVHLLVNLNKNLSLSQLVEQIKKSTSKWIKTLLEIDSDLKNFYWQRGYGAFSVSQSNLADVKRYIENQQTHHKKFNYQDELRQFLIKHGVHYNEEYLWD